MSLTIRPTLRDAAQQAYEALHLIRDGATGLYGDDLTRCNSALEVLSAALAEDVPPAPKELNEASLNELVEELKNLGSFGRFKPTHMLFDEKALEYCKKLERDDPETNFGNIPQPVAYISGYHKGRCIIEAVDPNVLLPVGMALYRKPAMTEQELEPIRRRMMMEAYNAADDNDFERYNALKVMANDVLDMLLGVRND